MSKLILLRHGESTFNREGRFAGNSDVPLTEKGIEQARVAAELLSPVTIGRVFVSERLRAQQTYETMRLLNHELPIAEVDARLNEQDFGDLEGVKKEEIERLYGAEQLQEWRRAFNAAPPKGERFLKVQMRVGAFYTEKVWPELLKNKHVLLVAHGNSLRALAIQLLAIKWHEIPTFALENARPLVLEFHAEGPTFTRIDG